MIKSNISIINTIKKPTFYLIFFLLILTLKGNAQPPQAVAQSYISIYGDEAVNQMLEYKIPASVILAQAILESGGGKSVLAKRSNNHFGIKCHREWGGDTIRKSDDTLNECFRRYNNVKDSYTDHSLFLKSRPRYKQLFKLSFTDYKGWCYGLKNYGYATHTCYTEDLIAIIEKYELYELDRVENLAFKPLLLNINYKTKESKLNSKISLKDFYNTNLVWYNEKFLLKQNLDYIKEPPNKEQLIVENEKFQYRSKKVKF